MLPDWSQNASFEIVPRLNYSSRMVFIWPFLPHFCLCLQGNVMGTARLKSTWANHCSKSTCPLGKSQKPLWSMLGTGHLCPVRWLWGIWVSPVAIVLVSLPIQWALNPLHIWNEPWNQHNSYWAHPNSSQPSPWAQMACTQHNP